MPGGSPRPLGVKGRHWIDDEICPLQALNADVVDRWIDVGFVPLPDFIVAAQLFWILQASVLAG